MRSLLAHALVMFALASSAAAVNAQCNAPVVPNERINAIAGEFRRMQVRIASSATILRYTFSEPGRPPQVDAIYVGGDERFAERMKKEARELRSYCARPFQPAIAVQLARLVTWNSDFGKFERRLDRELKLADVMKVIKESRHLTAQLDTRTMGCPFSLDFAPLQPYLPNRVEDPANNPLREPLVAWLRSATLAIPPDMMTTAIGQQSSILVPCAVLDLS
jgi:hypothetical protein